MESENKSPKKIKFIYKKSDNYALTYINGARGGISPQGELIFDLFQEHIILPEEEIRKIDDKKIGEIVDQPSLEIIAIRDSKIGVIMNIEKAEIIANWILSKVAEYNDIKKEMQNTGEC